MRILVVEDFEEVRKTLCEFLEIVDPDANIATAGNGQEGLQLLAAEEFDLLISDVDMVLMDGITMIRQVKKLNRIPPNIFLVTAQDLEEKLLKELGVTAYFKKPFILFNEFKAAIQSIKKP